MTLTNRVIRPAKEVMAEINRRGNAAVALPGALPRLFCEAVDHAQVHGDTSILFRLHKRSTDKDFGALSKRVLDLFSFCELKAETTKKGGDVIVGAGIKRGEMDTPEIANIRKLSDAGEKISGKEFGKLIAADKPKVSKEAQFLAYFDKQSAAWQQAFVAALMERIPAQVEGQDVANAAA